MLSPKSVPANDIAKGAITQLNAEYLQRYKVPAPVHAQHAYDAFLILEKAVARISGPATRDAIRDAVEKVEVSGTNGYFRFSPQNHRRTGRAIALVRDAAQRQRQVGGGRVRVLEHIDPWHLALRGRLEAAIDETSPLPVALALDREKRFDHALKARLGEIGAFGLVASADGGSGGDTVDQVIALEVLGRRAMSMAVYCVVSFLVTRMLGSYGSDRQKKAWLAGLLQGKIQGKIKGAFCLTESAGGTDILANTRTTARKQGAAGYSAAKRPGSAGPPIAT